MSTAFCFPRTASWRDILAGDPSLTKSVALSLSLLDLASALAQGLGRCPQFWRTAAVLSPLVAHEAVLQARRVCAGLSMSRSERILLRRLGDDSPTASMLP